VHMCLENVKIYVDGTKVKKICGCEEN